MLKDYGFIFRTDPEYAAKAARVSHLARDISEVLAELLPSAGAAAAPSPEEGAPLRVAYHSACSLQHGQKLNAVAPTLLRNAGFTVLDVPEGHICQAPPAPTACFNRKCQRSCATARHATSS